MAGKKKKKFELEIKTVPESQKIVKYKERSITPSDPIRRYIWEVNQYPLLSKEEEEELIRQYKNHHDVDAAKKILMAHLRLVVKISFEYYNQYYVSLFDLIQEGNLGIITAIKKFDPEKKVRFSTYAQWWIKAYILKYLMDNYSIIRIGHSRVEKRLFYSLKKAKEKLIEAGFDPDNTKKLAEYMREDERDVIEMNQRLSQGVVSLDQPISSDNSKNVASMIHADSANIEKDMIEKDLNEKLQGKLKEFAKDLEGKEMMIWKNRMLSEDPWSLQKIGDMFNISRERVRQIEERLTKRLKEFLSKQKDFKVEDFLIHE
ncbi:MAG: RNA polymerase factor sigma-32 [Spirochaetes bacterium]|nr:RNA polymerase factor sigma-32 [Spirochaetota bacterium]